MESKDKIIKPIVPDFILLSDSEKSEDIKKKDYIGSPILSIYQNKTHYDGHYLKYINKLNELIISDKLFNKIYRLIKENHESNQRVLILLTGIKMFDNNDQVYKNASQIYNHELYWNTITDIQNSNDMFIQLKEKLFKSDEEFNNFQKKFIDEGVKHFGSGWLWIYYNVPEQKLDVFTTHDSIVPFDNDKQKILGTIDLWEHAYYLDYQSDRKKYLEESLKIINWKKLLL